MSIVVRPATSCLGFDCSQRLNSKNAEDLFDYGFRWCARYLPLPGVSSHNDIDMVELGIICTAGLSLSVVQHCRLPGWNPADHSGAEDADNAVLFATAAGYPKGAHIFADLEGMSLETTAAEAKLFTESWASRINAAGFKAAAYVGYQIPLDADALWLLHGIDSYWSDAGPRSVSNRGFAIKQHAPQLTICGVQIDRDELAPDKIGDMPMVAIFEPDTQDVD